MLFFIEKWLIFSMSLRKNKNPVICTTGRILGVIPLLWAEYLEKRFTCETCHWGRLQRKKHPHVRKKSKRNHPLT